MKLINKLLLLEMIFSFFLVLLLIAQAGAEVQTLGTFKQNDFIELKQIGAGFTSCNITSLMYPNSSIALQEVEMTKTGNEYDYTINSTSVLGKYIVNGYCTDGTEDTVWSYDFDVTYNGRPEPGTGVIVFFSIGFLIIIGFLSYFFIYNIGHLGQMDYDLGDLMKNISAYFVLIGIYFLSTFYMGNEMIDSILIWIIGITGFTNVAMSFLFFIIVLLAKQKEMKLNKW